jgi:hypothetical protein
LSFIGGRFPWQGSRLDLFEGKPFPDFKSDNRFRLNPPSACRILDYAAAQPDWWRIKGQDCVFLPPGWTEEKRFETKNRPCQATDTLSRSIISIAARSPERTAPSMNPYMTAEVSLPAQWMRPQGSRGTELGEHTGRSVGDHPAAGVPFSAPILFEVVDG